MKALDTKKRRYLTIGVVALGMVAVGFWWSRDRRADELIAGLGAEDRAAAHSLSSKQKLLFAAVRPETQERALMLIAERDPNWTAWPEAVEAAADCAARIDEGTESRRQVGNLRFDRDKAARDRRTVMLTRLRFLTQFGASPQQVPPALVLTLADPDPVVRARARQATDALGVTPGSKGNVNPALVDRLRERLAVHLETAGRFSQQDLLAFLDLAAGMKEQARDATTIVEHVMNRSKDLAVRTAALKALIAIDSEWIVRTDPTLILDWMFDWLKRGDPAASDMVAFYLTNLRTVSEGVLRRIFPLTCHPNEAVQKAVWAAWDRSSPERRRGAATPDQMPKMLHWAEKADSAAVGGKLISEVVNRAYPVKPDLSRERGLWLDHLIVSLCAEPPTTRAVTLVALTEFSPDWRAAERTKWLATYLRARLKTGTPDPISDTSEGNDPEELLWKALREAGNRAVQQQSAREDSARLSAEAEQRWKAAEDRLAPTLPKPTLDELASSEKYRAFAERAEAAKRIRREAFEAAERSRRLTNMDPGDPTRTENKRLLDRKTYDAAVYAKAKEFLSTLDEK